MNRELAEKVANAVLYEGYMLYPYRASAIKNRQRWTFGTLYPPAYHEVGRGTERSGMQTECLLEAETPASVSIEFRFLHLKSRQLAQCMNKETIPVLSLIVDGREVASWDEAVERRAEFDVSVDGRLMTFDFSFIDPASAEPIRDGSGRLVGSVNRRQQEVRGTIAIASERIQDGLWKLRINVENTTPMAQDDLDRSAVLLRSLLSAQTILTASSGKFVSLLEPPEQFQTAALACRNIGNFPVLVGPQGERDMVLCSPILLYDYPQVAPESVGDFYDATEMDEMLTLRVMTLTDEEKSEMRLADDHARNLLERTEQSAREQLARTHGTIRSLRPLSGK